MTSAIIWLASVIRVHLVNHPLDRLLDSLLLQGREGFKSVNPYIVSCLQLGYDGPDGCHLKLSTHTTDCFASIFTVCSSLLFSISINRAVVSDEKASLTSTEVDDITFVIHEVSKAIFFGSELQESSTCSEH